jgi:hypothetical protein
MRGAAVVTDDIATGVAVWGEAPVVMPRGCRLRLNLVTKDRVSFVVCDRCKFVSVDQSSFRCVEISRRLVAAEG